MSIKIQFVTATLLIVSSISAALAAEYFDQTEFEGVVSSNTVITFDELAPGNNLALEAEYSALGLTIIHRDGGPINIVQNLVPGGFGGNFVTESGMNSSPNTLSSSIEVNSATGQSDNFDFVLDPMVSAAGLYIGNLGNCHPTYRTTVQFLDDQGQIIEEELLHQLHPDAIFGDAVDTVCGGQTPLAFDVRLFYGITSNTPNIKTIRVLNGLNDGDGINIDDVQYGYTADYHACLGFEPPMANYPVTAKKNRALPLKAEILDADGLPVLGSDLTAPPIIQVWQEYGTPDADDVSDDALPAGQGTEGNQFVFTDDFKWQFNLKTSNYSGPGTYTVIMESGDPSEYVIDPSCLTEFVIK